MLSAVKRSWSNGSLLIVSGGILCAGSGIMLWKMEDDTSFTVLKSDMANYSYKIPTSNDVTSDPILYRATITRALSASFDGSAALKGLTKDESVGIVKQNVGPNGDYHLARSYTKSGKTPKSEGWYPKRFMIKTPTPSV